MKPPFRYFGGKARLAPWIVSLLPEHDTYVEPFAGSAAVLFAKPPVRNEVLNDLDGNVVAFYRVLRDRPDELIRRLELTPYAREEFYACRDGLGPDEDIDDVERARRLFTLCSQSVACTTKPSTGWSTSVLKNANRARSTAQVDDDSAQPLSDLPEAVDVLYGTPSACLYVDPPYLYVTRDLKRRRGNLDSLPAAAAGYAVDMGDVAAHVALAEQLHATPAAVVLSGYAHPLYDEDLYRDWWRVDVSTTYNAGAGGARARTEVIWSNRPLNEARLFDMPTHRLEVPTP